ncbi:MAG: MoaD/ThiS family protein [Desulfobulbus sp.]|jgi:molybdopterin synthase sulfur carrier subunit
MRITVKLFAYFRDNRFREQIMDVAPGTRVEDLIHNLALPLDELGVTMINSRHCSLDDEPKEGDIVAIFPAIGGG